MNNGAQIRRALSVAVAPDFPMQFIQPAAERIHDLLEGAGWTSQLFTDGNATQPVVRQHIQTHTGGIHFTYFSAHGASRELGLKELAQADPDHPLLITADNCNQHLGGSISVFSSCLANRTFPDEIAHPQGNLHAVLGYCPYLVIGMEDELRRELGSDYQYYREQFNDILVRPIQYLLRGRTIAEAVNDGRRGWETLAKSMPRNSLSRKYWTFNQKWFRSWGRRDAKLCS